MKKVIFTTACCFIVFSSLLAQKKPSLPKLNFVTGRILKTGSDTLNGFIAFPKSKENPRSIIFKQKLSDTATNYDSKTIAYFQIEGRGSFEKAEVVKDMRPVTVTEISARTEDSYVKDTVFLKVVVKGRKLNLFQLIDAKYHYYIQVPGRSMNELIYRLELAPADASRQDILAINDVRSNFQFRSQLEQFIPEARDPGLFSTINKARYFESELKKIVLRLNKDIL